jgi:DNA (cytosine-5)-methyltransferase 1
VCARLQGYKDSWLKFPKDLSKNQAYKQVGNSITVPLVVKLADGMLTELEQQKKSKAKANVA